MEIRAAIRDQSCLRAAGIALAVILGTWSIPALASTGIVADCDDADTRTTLVATTSTTMPADVDEAAEKPGAKEDNTAEEAASPKTVTTHLPGVSDATSSSFRRQMLRTDI